MKCVKCGRRLKLRDDGWRRCGKGCSKVMGVELRCATFGLEVTEPTDPLPLAEFKLKLKPTWKAGGENHG